VVSNTYYLLKNVWYFGYLVFTNNIPPLLIAALSFINYKITAQKIIVKRKFKTTNYNCDWIRNTDYIMKDIILAMMVKQREFRRIVIIK